MFTIDYTHFLPEINTVDANANSINPEYGCAFINYRVIAYI